MEPQASATSGLARIRAHVVTHLPPGSIESHPLLQALATDRLSPTEAQAVALDVFFVVRCFPQFLAGLISNLSDYRPRMPLVENLFEEHGRMKHAAVHEETFRLFLTGLGVEEERLAKSEPSIPALAYCRAMLSLCRSEPAPEALGALGVVEEIVARVSPLVSKYGLRHQLGAHASSAHFGVHEVLDLRHAEEIYELAARSTSDSPERWNQVTRGINMGIYLQRRLYSDLISLHTSAVPSSD